MKPTLMLLLLFILPVTVDYAQSGSAIETAVDQNLYKYDSTWYVSNFISVADAEKILKQPVYIKDSTWKYSNHNFSYLRYKFTYNAVARDSVTKTTSSLFFSLEQFQQLSLAKKTFDDIKKLNVQSAMYTPLSGLGDEAFLTRDALNNPFIVIKKSNSIYKLRMLHVAEQSANEELLLLAKKITTTH